MDKLALDLTNALEDLSRKQSSSKVKKSRPWKRRSGCLTMMGTSLPKSSAVSDDSESSLDIRVQHPMELSTGSRPPSDSDDVQKVTRLSQKLTSWRHCSLNLGESDSWNENFYPSREQRRKRKFKRMTVDPQALVEPEHKLLSCVSLLPQKAKRVRCLKTSKNKKLSKLYDAALETICGELTDKTTIYCGKRKRSMREKNLECGSFEDYHSMISEKSIHSGGNSICSNHLMELDSICEKWHEVSSSGLSSSESECGVLTNDESREADDEQSDFFHEAGPTCPIDGMDLWWEDDPFLSTITTLSDRNSEVRRLIRSGRRRLLNAQTPSVILPEKNFNLKKTDKVDSFLPKCHETIGKLFANDIKRRRRMPPLASPLCGDHASDGKGKALEKVKEDESVSSKVSAHSEASPTFFTPAERNDLNSFSSLSSTSTGNVTSFKNAAG